MHKSKVILEYLNGKQEDFLELLKQAVLLESPSYGGKAYVDKCGEFLQGIYAKLGMDITIFPQEEVGDHFRADIGSGDDTIMMLCHYDTVFPVNTLETMPFKREGNILKGPGVFDMKGGLIQAHFAIKALMDLDLMPKRKIAVLATSDEEPGSFTSRELIKEEAKKCRAVIVLEPGLETLGSVKTIRSGRGTYKITAHGKPAHAGHHPHLAINPITELSFQISKIKEMSDYAKGTSVSPIFIEGGVDGARMIPETASITLDTRYASTEAVDIVDKKLQALEAVLEGSKLEIVGGVDKIPLTLTEENEKLFNLAYDIAKELGFELEGKTVGGGSDGNTVAETDTPILDGYGMIGGGIHTPDEYLYIDCIPKRTALVAQLLRLI